ncbi:uncharacterized protein KQ657_004386 [Scheffersomyces spartinae]|uniref:N-acetyltransferase domain-containing protein n=1 Tax=Scheffersomyces spartinae TaxID=45513 RepID=A0A9P7VCB5_9ASCO|nr:uncharacterized protein KQ657_004386 [Scheffersomyces spartinae]KAG7194709.1 hypothetical protein KQ657_004386 [Scheffersomyces spartinae]
MGLYKYEELQSLPFSSGDFSQTPRITTPLHFSLEKLPETNVTLFPVHDSSVVPKALKQVICDEFNHIIDEGKTYPYVEVMEVDEFVDFWFKHFVAILIETRSEIESQYEFLDQLGNQNDIDFWRDRFLGNFYVKPNYIGRSSHICNAGFVVNHQKRGLGLGKELGKKYLVWGPQLGYLYSVFNLVYETNIASVKIWDSLGFDRIGYVKGSGILKGEDKPVGAIVFGKDF